MANSRQALRRGQLGLFGVIMPGLAQVAPAFNLFFTTGVMVALAGASAPLIFLISMVGMGATASSLAQFAGVYPSAGSFITYITKAIGTKVATAIGVITILGYIIAFGGIYIFVGQYIVQNVLGDPHIWGITQIVTILYGALVVAPVVVGLKFGVRVTVALYVFEVVLLLALSLTILARGGANGLSATPFHWPGGSKDVLLAFSLAVLAFGGFEAAAPLLFEAALKSAKDRGMTKLFTAYRRDWDAVLQFFADNGFAKARDMINYWADPLDLPTIANRSNLPISRLRREDVPALAEMGKGVIRLPADKLEQYFFSNPYYPVEAMLVMRGRDRDEPVAVAIGLEVATWADVKKVDPLAPCFRMGAFGTEGLNTKRVNGLFSLVAKPEHTIAAGLGLLSEATQEMTEGTVEALAAQCPSDAPQLLNFYHRYFKEQGRFPVLERTL